MNHTIEASYTSPAQRVEIRTELQRARWGRALSERLRGQSSARLRESVLAARSAGLTTAAIAGLVGVTQRRVQQILNPKDPHE